ncbi:hypothetical protein [Microbulbifer halophilus]|uniref:DUF3313 domain-containing protein n=1 Tax=Microbulbifer halophilus TaxID=453963 RepID=A0ABW5E9U5_9GAMM|nr:hypothetical protein [Microbulbifer halophilus]MCW8126817.1 hypothetical protein [Microbulbifer halophilus]
MRNLLLSCFVFSLLLSAGCARQAAAPAAPVAVPAAADGLQARASGLDQVAAVFAFDLSGASVYVAPVEIDYRKRFDRATDKLRARDYELETKDREKLNGLMAETFAERFLAPRNSRLAQRRQNADYVLKLRLENFSLSAPLEPSAHYWRVYTQQSAYAVLTGTLYDRDGNPVMRFRDRREIGDNFGRGVRGSNLDRFTSVTFWSDMKVDMRRAFGSLDKSLR